MGQNEYESMLSKGKSLIQDEYYFKYIFKKTEKIVCAVFYVLQSIKDIPANELLIEDIKDHCLDTLSFVSDSLSVAIEQVEEAAEVLSFKLIALESKLRVLHASGIIPQEHLNVFAAEIESTLRSAKSYGWTTSVSTPRPESRTLVRTPGIAPTPRSVSVPQGAHEDRRTRIVSVLKAQPGASIKDVVDSIKDCSEKTIQRELNALIKDGLVVREGERRWSKYRVS